MPACAPFSPRTTRLTDIEVIVADGGSTDRTRGIVGAIAERDPRVRLIDNPGRMQAAGLNRAIQASRGRHHRASGRPRRMGARSPPALGRDPPFQRGRQRRRSSGGHRRRRARPRDRPCHELAIRGRRRSIPLLRTRGGHANRLSRHVPPQRIRTRRPLRRGVPASRGLRAQRTDTRRPGGRIVFSPEIRTRYHVRSGLRRSAASTTGTGAGKVRVARAQPRGHPPVSPGRSGAGRCDSGDGRDGGDRAGPAPGARRRRCLPGGVRYRRPAGGSRRIASTCAMRIPAAFAVMHVAWGAGFWAGVVEAARGIETGGGSPPPLPSSAANELRPGAGTRIVRRVAPRVASYD